MAYTLKARYHQHWVEANGAGQYQQALDAAQNGTSSPANNWRSIHSSAATENNLWYQFMRDRSGYIAGGHFLIPMLNNGTPTDFSDDDPRLPLYYSVGEIDGAEAYAPEVSSLSATGAGAPEYEQPIASCAETHFIIAEAHAALDDEAAAHGALEDALACQEER